MRIAPLVCCCVLLAAFAAPQAHARAQEAPLGRIVFAATRTADGNSDIFSADLAGETAVNLTADPAPDRSPTWSPDGRQIVFASQRGANWDLYQIAASGGTPQRLTNDPAYDGEPAFSPDGRRIAFSSSRSGNLEIYLLELASGALSRVTDDPAADAQPTWAPDGQRLAFSSWRDGNQEIYAVYLRDLAGGTPVFQNLSAHPAPDYSPAWSPDGRRLAYLSDRDGPGNLHVVDLLNGTQQKAGPYNRSLQDPAWTPDGALLAAGPAQLLSRRSNTQGVLIMSVGISTSVALVSSAHTYGTPRWSAAARAPAVAADQRLPGRILPVSVPPADPAQLPNGLVGLGDVRSGGRPALAAAVAPSFAALRSAVIAASGHDFLARLSEATRAVGFSSGTSSYTSWHKAGRAFDTLFSYQAGGRQVLYIAPEWQGGRLFWRLYLRAAQQDGSRGAPLIAPVYDTAAGVLRPPPGGYFVDFTALAAEHGWRRIAAQERDDFDWRSELLALEYWHFERRDGLSWYNAMHMLYDDTTLQRLFSADALMAAGARPDTITRFGFPWAPPLPPSAPSERPLLKRGAR